MLGAPLPADLRLLVGLHLFVDVPRSRRRCRLLAMVPAPGVLEMTATDTRAVTPLVYAHLRRTIDVMDKGSRPNFYAAAGVLDHLARWAKDRGLVDLTIKQIAEQRQMPEKQVRYSLDALTLANLATVVQRGGPGHGTKRRLRLDYLDDGELRTYSEADDLRDSARQDGRSRGQRTAPVLGGLRAETNSARNEADSAREGSELRPSWAGGTKGTSNQPSTGDALDAKARAAVEFLVDHKCNGRSIQNPRSYKQTVREAIQRDHGERISELARKFPDAPVSLIAHGAESGETRNLAFYLPSEAS